MKSEKILKKYTLNLLQKKNVVMVGLGTKCIGGVDTYKEALVIGVKKKLPVSSLAAKDVIPATIQGLPTDVLEVGEIKLLSEDRTKKWRPAPGGVSVGHKDVSAGTLGCLVYRDGEVMILSNNHVLANCNSGKIGDAILQPGVYDGGVLADEIAKLYDFVEISMVEASQCPIANSICKVCNFFSKALHRRSRLVPVTNVGSNTVDCAIAKPNQGDDVTNRILEIGIINGEVEPELNLKVKKSGRTTGLTEGKITQTGVSINVDMGDGRTALFTDQFAMEGHMSEPGDSGSAIIGGTKIVGLLFAGSDTITIANKFSNVKKSLKLRDM